MVGTSYGWTGPSPVMVDRYHHLCNPATLLSRIPQEWSHSSQELSAKLQSLAETATSQSFIKKHYDSNTRFLRHPAGSKPYAAGPCRSLYDLPTQCSSCRKRNPWIDSSAPGCKRVNQRHQPSPTASAHPPSGSRPRTAQWPWAGWVRPRRHPDGSHHVAR